MKFGPDIITDNLIFAVDAANPNSYASGSRVWKDQTVNQNDGNFVNGPTFNTNFGGCIDFDGINDYIDCDDTTNLEGIDSLTVDTWVYPSIDGSGPALGIISRDSTSTRSWYLATYLSNTFRWFVSTDGSSNDSMNSSTNFSLNTWYNVTATWSDQGMFIYINGVFDTSQSLVNTSSPLPNISEPLKIAERQSGQEWNGKISNIKIYNRALSANEVLHNYNALKSRFGL